jgi:hypothetical protein
MFGPDDPGYSAETISTYQTHPARWYAHREHARALVGCAVGHVVCGTSEDLRRARQAVNRAIALFQATGLTRAQAINQVISLAEMLGSLE